MIQQVPTRRLSEHNPISQYLCGTFLLDTPASFHPVAAELEYLVRELDIAILMGRAIGFDSDQGNLMAVCRLPCDYHPVFALLYPDNCDSRVRSDLATLVLEITIIIRNDGISVLPYRIDGQHGHT